MADDPQAQHQEAADDQNQQDHRGKALHRGSEKAMGYIQECVKNQKICGDGPYTKKCSEWIERKTGTAKCLLTTFCTMSGPHGLRFLPLPAHPWSCG